MMDSSVSGNNLLQMCIELLSFRKHLKAVAARVHAARSEREIATEDALAKAKICCAGTVVISCDS